MRALRILTWCGLAVAVLISPVKCAINAGLSMQLVCDVGRSRPTQVATKFSSMAGSVIGKHIVIFIPSPNVDPALQSNGRPNPVKRHYMRLPNNSTSRTDHQLRVVVEARPRWEIGKVSTLGSVFPAEEVPIHLISGAPTWRKASIFPDRGIPPSHDLSGALLYLGTLLESYHGNVSAELAFGGLPANLDSRSA